MLALIAAAHAQTCKGPIHTETIYVLADTFISEGDPGDNFYGKEYTLSGVQPSGEWWALYDFAYGDLKPLLTNLAIGGCLHGATFEVHASFQDGPTSTIELFTAKEFEPSLVTWNTMSSLLELESNQVLSLGWNTFSATGAVLTWLDLFVGGEGDHAGHVALKAKPPASGAWYFAFDSVFHASGDVAFLTVEWQEQ
jgi:hypothetical protein